MTKFIAGVLVTIAVQLLGWDTIEIGLSKASNAVQSSFSALEAGAERVKSEAHGRAK